MPQLDPKIAGHVSRLRSRYAARDGRMLRIRTVREGNMELLFPDQFSDEWPKQITANMLGGLDNILAEDHPSLVIWQAGTSDAINGVETEDFRSSLENGVEKIQNAGADVILMNMQYSPRTGSMLDVSAYADVMRHVAQQRNALLFDRLAIMQYWNDNGTFDLYAATKKYDMAREVHECIGRALASQIINAAHLDAVRMQTTR